MERGSSGHAVASPPVEVRRRIRQACDACRRRRRKCDGNIPCSQCHFYQYQCSFTGASDDINVSNAHLVGKRRSRAISKARDRTDGRLPETSFSPDEADNIVINQLHFRNGSVQEPESQSKNDCDSSNNGEELPASFFDARKGRYCGIHSSIVFPQFVRAAVGHPDSIRLHSYAWNVNLRAEPQPPGWSSIRRVITYQEILTYSNVFLDVLNPVLGLFEPSVYRERSRAYWALQSDPSLDFEAVAAGVFALGSLFSLEGSMAEPQLVEHAKSILDIGSCYAPGRQSVDQAAAWALRTLYLRMTTRPSVAWFASCFGMHVAEAMALHVQRFTDDGDPFNTRVHVLHVMLFLNATISAEYGRSRVRFNDCQDDYPGLSQPSALSNLSKELFAIEPPLSPEDRVVALRAITTMNTVHDVHELFKIDIAIHWYRRQIYGRNSIMTPIEHSLLLDALAVGFPRVRSLLTYRHPWWNVVSTPFQSLLVLLVIDSDKSLALVPEAMECLRKVARTFQASLATEAVETAEGLVGALKQKKVKQTTVLDCGDRPNDVSDIITSQDPRQSIDQYLFDHTMDDLLGMSQVDGNSIMFWPADVRGS